MSNSPSTRSINRAVKAVYSKLVSRNGDAKPWVSLTESQLYEELIACVLGSRVRFETAHDALSQLKERGLLFVQDPLADMDRLENMIAMTLKAARYPFHSSKAKYIRKTYEVLYKDSQTLHSILARNAPATDTRKYLATLIPGIGPKQASLFLRNVHYCQSLAILDSHVLHYLELMGLGEKIEPPRSYKSYESVESIFVKHARTLGLESGPADLAVWLVMKTMAEDGVLD